MYFLTAMSYSASVVACGVCAVGLAVNMFPPSNPLITLSEYETGYSLIDQKIGAHWEWAILIGIVVIGCGLLLPGWTSRSVKAAVSRLEHVRKKAPN